MTRMTNDLRAAMVQTALDKSGYTEQDAALNARRKEWSTAVRLDSIGMSEEAALTIESQAIMVFNGIPEPLQARAPALCRRDYMDITIAGQRDTVHFAKAIAPYTHTIPADHPLAVEREKILCEIARLKELKESVRAPVRAALASINTVAQLLKIWPEAIELIPPVVPEAKPQFPTVMPADLNALIGLPSQVSK